MTDTLSGKQRFSQVMSTCSILSAVMVVWIHTYNIEIYGCRNGYIYWLEELLSQGIARSAVPFFLMSSAFFLYSKNKKTMDVYRSRAKSLLIPYLLWNVVYTVIFAIMYRLSLSSDGLTTLSVGSILESVFLHRYNYAYWFMRDLIIFAALYPLIRWVLQRGKVASWAMLAVVIVVLHCGVLWLESSLYYLVGAIIGHHYTDAAEKICSMSKKYQITITLVLFCICTVLFWLRNGRDIDSLESVRDLMLAFLLVFVVVTCNIRISGALACFSFMIYSIHPVLLEVIEKTIYLYLPHTNFWVLFDYVVAPIICIALIIGICVLWKKWLPGVYRVFNGGRL